MFNNDDQDGNESSEQYTEEQTIDWGTRIINSFKEIFIGLLLFFLSFWILTWNEGHANLDNFAKTAVEISSISPNSTHIGKLVSTTGIITSNGLLGDNLFLKPGKYIAVARAVEMYSWVEKKSTEKKTNIGGYETQTKTFTYTKAWVDSEWAFNDSNSTTDSSSFHYSKNHQNPRKYIKNAAYKVASAKVGIYNLDMASLQLPSPSIIHGAVDPKVIVGYYDLPTPSPITPTAEKTISTPGVVRAGDYLYKRAGSLPSPQVGDLRIRYAALNADTNVTVFGKLNSNNSISPYMHSNNHRFYRIFPGTRDQAVSRLNTEGIFTWGFRLLGFIMMWIGLKLIYEPISVVLDFFPILGAISREITGFSTFIISFILTVVTILVYNLTHNGLVLAATVFATFVVAITLLSQKSKNRRHR